MKNKKIVLDNIKDLVINLTYYDRKEDDKLPVGKIQQMVKESEITINEMVSVFEKELKKQLND